MYRAVSLGNILSSIRAAKLLANNLGLIKTEIVLSVMPLRMRPTELESINPPFVGGAWVT